MKPLLQVCQSAWQRVSTRDRRVLAMALLAAVVTSEALLVWPLQKRRAAAEQAHLDESRSREQAAQDRLTAADQRKIALTLQLNQVQAELRLMGRSDSRREGLSAMLQRTLAHEGLVLQGLKALPPERVVMDASAEPTATAAAAVDAAASASEPAADQVYRHRVELKVAGGGLPLLQRLDTLAQQVAPLRVERVRVAAGEDGQAQATLILFTIGPERAWLEL